jgi:FkbH-like protein
MSESALRADAKSKWIILELIHKAFSRTSGLSIGERVRRSAIMLMDMTNARWSLRKCDSVGSGARVKGRMRVENRGSMAIGNRLFLVSHWIPTELLTGERGRIEIGQGAWINFGAVIAAHKHVTIGDRVMIGQHCIISDTDFFPDMPSVGEAPGARAVEIGDDVWLAGRVTVRPGVKIGAGSVIISGSIVESDIPANVIAGGIPARPLSRFPDQPIPQPEVMPEAANPVSAAPPHLFGHLISDFTIDELATELRAPDLNGSVGSRIAPFGQVVQMLLSPAPADAADFAVVWTRPESAIPSFSRLVAFEAVDEHMLRAEVDEFCRLIGNAAKGYRFVFVPSWTLPSWERGLGMLDTRQGGATLALTAMNLRLMERLSETPNVFVLNATRWFEAVGPTANNPKAWYLGKIAVAQPALAEAARDIRAALGALSGGPRKLLVVDLDDTLWGGIVGDVGWEELRLGGLDGVGEAFVDFQKSLKDLTRRGIVLGIVSKNEESVALEAIRNHPAMVLREEDFVGWRINWTDKATNILDLTKTLNLGLQSVVFIDDNPVERARVREALPDVYVPDWPSEPFLYPSALHNLRCFDPASLSREDLERTRMYGEERSRAVLRETVGSLEEWLKTLKIQVKVEPISAATSLRASQLLNKTNQLNLTTRRLTEAELLSWAEHKDHAFWVVSVADRFGDAGLTGLLGLEFAGDVATVVDFVLSCRVMGRKVEETIVHVAVAAAIARSASCVRARYLPTAKNKPCLSFWQSSGFNNDADAVFTWNTAQPYPLSDAIRLDWRQQA